MHYVPNFSLPAFVPLHHYGGERQETRNLNTQMPSPVSSDSQVLEIDSKCTEICKGTFPGKSYAKIVSVNVYLIDCHEKRVKTIAILDEHRNRSLARVIS